MKVLVATKEKQIKGDFCNCEEGEIVMYPYTICNRTDKLMVGTKTLQETTTMKVVEKDISAEQFRNIIKKGLKKAEIVEDLDSQITHNIEILPIICNSFSVDAIIKRNKGNFNSKEEIE